LKGTSKVSDMGGFRIIYMILIRSLTCGRPTKKPR